MDNSGDPYGFIYITTNNVNGKRYIGKRRYDKRGMWKTYLGSGMLLKRAIKKYGREQLTRKIIDIANSETELNEKEKYWIRFYNAVEDSEYYNVASGGDGGNVRVGYTVEEYEISERRRIDAVRKGHLYGERSGGSVLTEANVKAIIMCLKNNGNMAEIGRKFGVREATVCDILHGRTWRHLTSCEDFSGRRTTYNYGQNAKPVIQYDSEMNYVAAYSSAREAELATGIGHKLISKVCRGNRPSTHGFVFQFA